MTPADIMTIAGALSDCVENSHRILKQETERMKNEGCFGAKTDQKPFVEHHVDWQNTLKDVCARMEGEDTGSDCVSTIIDACDSMGATIAKSESILEAWRKASNLAKGKEEPQPEPQPEKKAQKFRKGDHCVTCSVYHPKHQAAADTYNGIGRGWVEFDKNSNAVECGYFDDEDFDDEKMYWPPTSDRRAKRTLEDNIRICAEFSCGECLLFADPRKLRADGIEKLPIA